MRHQRSKIYVAVSGGVDSSVALMLLRDAGYDVTGVYFKTYRPDGDRSYCKQQGTDAEAVCKMLGVPFKVYDLQEQYRERVFNYMIEQYRAGRTPNPDIVCNREIKFGLFAEMAFADGADCIATGHYARLGRVFRIMNYEFRFNALISTKSKSCGWPQQEVRKIQHATLNVARDTDKDQTYFLSQVRQDILTRTLFPLARYRKEQVRALAERAGLPTARKPDSQGLCFVGEEINLKELLREYVPISAGAVLDTTGARIGRHNGVHLLTVGERHGFSISPEYQTPDMPRLFVISRDVSTNTVTVGTREELDKALSEMRRTVSATHLNWIGTPPRCGARYTCRIRHRGALHRCVIEELTDEHMRVRFIDDVPFAPAEGQFIALYDGERCLGGGEMRWG